MSLLKSLFTTTQLRIVLVLLGITTSLLFLQTANADGWHATKRKRSTLANPFEQPSTNTHIAPAAFQTPAIEPTDGNSPPPLLPIPDNPSLNSNPDTHLESPYYESQGETFYQGDNGIPHFQDSAIAPPESFANPEVVDFALNEQNGWIYWKRTELTGTWLPGKDNKLGIASFDLKGTIGFGGAPGFTIAPQLGIHALNGPTRTDLPGKVINFSTDFQWLISTDSPWAFELGITPGIYTSLQKSSGDAFRLQARAIASYRQNEVLTWVLGIAFLDRENINALPVAGFIYKPHPNTVYEMVFPRLKFSQRYRIRPDYDSWAYIKGEFGGGSWAIQRAGGAKDIATYNDLRLIFGWERRYRTGTNLFFEVGYVFSRELEYKSGLGDYDPSGTAMLRTGVSF